MTYFNSLKRRSKHSLFLVAVASCTALGGCGAEAGDDPANTGGTAGSAGSAGTAGSAGSAGSSGSGGDAGSGGSSGDPVQDYFDALPAWGEVPDASDTASDPTTERRHLSTVDGKSWPFACTLVKHDIVEKQDEILNFDSGAEYVKPGMILVGNDFVKGSLSPIPLPRAPITLSINVPGVTTASVRVEDPNVSNIQQGIATLQAQAQEAAKGSYAAQLSYKAHAVQSVEEMSYKLGVSASFDGLFANGAFSAKFANQESVEKHTVVTKLMQQMYTITFAQDSFATARDFFASSLTQSQIAGAEKNGFLGQDNVPVFIGSVTYGRMVVFTATSTQATSNQQLETTLQAAGATWKASTDLSAEQKAFLASLDIEVLAVGGNQAEVTNAIKTGNWSDLYAGADILNSVPLRYTVHALSGVRPIASIGDTTSFVASDCSTIQGWYDTPGPAGTVFTDVSTNPSNNPVFAIGRNGSTYTPYRLEGEQFVPVAGFASGTPLQIAVDDVGNAYIQDTDPVAPKIYRLPVGGAAWATRDGANGGQLWFDAGGQDMLVAISTTYSDNQNDLYQMNWSTGGWAYWVDEAQWMKSGEAPWFSVITDGMIGRWAGGLYRWYWNGSNQALSGDTAELDSVQKYSAASVNEIYALRKATGEVVRFNSGTTKFDSPIAPPATKAIADLEATSAGRLWAVTSDGMIYAYSPAH